MSTGDDVVKVVNATKLAVDFISEMVKNGLNPEEEMTKLIDLHPLRRAADAEVEDALNRKFPR